MRGLSDIIEARGVKSNSEDKSSSSFSSSSNAFNGWKNDTFIIIKLYNSYIIIIILYDNIIYIFDVTLEKTGSPLNLKHVDFFLYDAYN